MRDMLANPPLPQSPRSRSPQRRAHHMELARGIPLPNSPAATPTRANFGSSAGSPYQCAGPSSLPIASMMAYNSPTKHAGVRLTDEPLAFGSQTRLAFPTSPRSAKERPALGSIQDSPRMADYRTHGGGPQHFASGVSPSKGTAPKSSRTPRGRPTPRREPLKDHSSDALRYSQVSLLPSTSDDSRRTASTSFAAHSRASSQCFSDIDSETLDADFENLLNQMEVASALRGRLLGLDASVKMSMLRGKETLTLASLGGMDLLSSPSKRSASPTKRSSSPSKSLRQQKSNSVLRAIAGTFGRNSDPTGSAASPEKDKRASGSWGKSSSGKGSPPLIGMGTPSAGTGLFSAAKSKVRSRASSFSSMIGSSVGAGSSTSSSGARQETASYLATYLKTHEARLIDVARIKRMRAVLATESPAFIDAFAVSEGGYAAMLARLDELLQMEWREEQHDDQLLHELLRCFVALNTTDRGRSVLLSKAPKPFVALVDLLFSEKKPGDLATRKLLIDLLIILSTLPLQPPLYELDEVAAGRPSSSCLVSVQASQGLTVAEEIVLILAHNPRTPQSEAMLDFITAGHTPRPFKTLISEITGVTTDYFWIFCHGQNGFWRLDQVDERSLEEPKVPGGMTGGVEFEAMAYLTSAMQLINTIGRAVLRASAPAAYDFIHLLFSSGMERLLSVLRRASQVYYQTMHLALARFLDICERAGYAVPAALSVWHPPGAGGLLSRAVSPAKPSAAPAQTTRPVPRPPTLDQSSAGASTGDPVQVKREPVPTAAAVRPEAVQPAADVEGDLNDISFSGMADAFLNASFCHSSRPAPSAAAAPRFPDPRQASDAEPEAKAQAAAAAVQTKAQLLTGTPLLRASHELGLEPPQSPARFGSAVGSAVRRWEELASPHPSPGATASPRPAVPSLSGNNKGAPLSSVRAAWYAMDSLAASPSKRK